MLYGFRSRFTSTRIRIQSNIFFFHFLICIWYKERSGTARNPKESETLVMGLLLSLFLILQVVVAVDAVAVEAELTIRKTITVELNKRSTVESLR
jgi:hypothetical protein